MKIQPTIIDSIEHTDWKIQNWKIKFVLSEKQLGIVRKHAKVDNWYEHPVITDTWVERMDVCVFSIQQFYNSFGTLPHIGDRLFDKTTTGVTIEERSIDGYLRTITFTLST